MNNTLRRILTLILSALLIVSVVMTLRHQLFTRKSQQANQRAAELVKQEKLSESSHAAPTPAAVAGDSARWQPVRPLDDPYLAELEQMDISALRDVNPDVLGWISIPGTGIDYPLVQTGDNEHYLKYSWDGERNDLGAIFLECTNPADMSAFHSIIYGHNMGKDKMFGPLRSYADEAFFREHPYVYVYTDAGVYRYEVYSAYQTRVDTISYGIAFPSQTSLAAFLLHSVAQSEVDSGIEPKHTDRILSLSTCSGDIYDERWIVHARLAMELQQK